KRNCGETGKPVRADREQGGKVREQPSSRCSIRADELACCLNRIQPSLCETRKSRSKRSSWFYAGWRLVPCLLENATAAVNSFPSTCPLCGNVSLDDRDGCTHACSNLFDRSELWRDRHRQRDLLGHGAVVTKEVERSTRMQCASRHQGAVRVYARPLLD